MGWAAAAVLAAVAIVLGVKVWLLRRGARALRQHPAVPALPGQGIAAAGIIPQ